jgi:glycosyltransferase involved in cell wall biosynthesis
MKITCLLPSHNRPDGIRRSIASVLAQTYTDWQAIVLDSGAVKPEFDDPRVQVHQTGETEELRRYKWALSVSLNNAIPLIKGELVCVLCDDDVYYPNALATFATIRPEQHAVYASIERDGQPDIMAWEIAGLSSPHRMDCRVDGMQICFRRSLLDTFVDERPWPEELQCQKHSDGVFMDRLGTRCYIWPIPTIIGKKL